MFHAISWTQFIWMIGLILLIYYFTVCLIFFRFELASIVRHQFKKINTASTTHSFADLQDHVHFSPKVESVASPDDIAFSNLHDFLEDLKRLLHDMKIQGRTKDWLLTELVHKMAAIKHLSESPVKFDLELHICMQGRELGGIDISPEELKNLWLG